MRITLKILFLLFICTIAIQAQTDTNDAVQENLEKIDEESRIDLLIQLIWKNRSKNPDKAIQYGFEAIELAEKYNRIHDEAKANSFLGIVYRNTGAYLKAINYYSTALKLAQSINDTVQIAYAYNNLGGVYRAQGKYPEAVEKILAALKVFESIGDKAGIGFCTINIAICYKSLGNYQLALEYFERTAEIRKEIGDEFGLALTYNYFAELYFVKNNFAEAIKYYKMALGMFEELNDQKGIASVYGGMGGIYYSNNDFKKALELRKKSLEINKEIKNQDGIIVDQNNMGLIYQKIGQANRGLLLIKSSLSLALNMDAGNRVMETYKILSDFYENQKDYRKAFEYSKNYQEKSEEIFNKEKHERISEMQTQYEIESQIKENAFLKKNLEIEKKQTTYLAVFAILILSILIILYMQFRSKQKLNEKLNDLLAARDKFFYIIAHDLKSPFNSLKGYSFLLKENFDDFSKEEKKSAINDISEVTDKVYNLVENLLDWSRFQTGSLDISYERLNLQEILNTNTKLFEQSAKNKNISISNREGEDVSVLADEYMLNVVIRNLLNNAIKFSFKDNSINLFYSIKNKFAEISVEDSGIGINEGDLNKLFRIDVHYSTPGTDKEKGTGLGLILCKEFVQKMGGDISVESTKNKGSKFTFTIPLAP